MSRIGKNPITIPEGVSIKVDEKEGRKLLTVSGKLGTLNYSLCNGIRIVTEDNLLKVNRSDDSKEQRSLHGLTRALIYNMVTGVSSGFEKELHIVGTGYNAEIKGHWLKMVLGYSHDILIQIPSHLTVEAVPVPRSKGRKTDLQTIVKVRGISKEAVGNFAAEIRKCRPPENYKGKGIRYSDENVTIKAGKTGA